MLAVLIRFLKKMNVVFVFYLSFFLLSSVISLGCLFLYWIFGIKTFFILFWFKVFSLFLIYYFVNIRKENEYYYYLNFGVSKTVLWSVLLIFDFILFLVTIILVHNYR